MTRLRSCERDGRPPGEAGREARDTPTVQVLDKAAPAERKSKPKTTLNMAIAGALSLFVGIFLAFFLEDVERIKQQTTPAHGS